MVRRTRWLAPAAVLTIGLGLMLTAGGSVLVKGVLTDNGYRWRPKTVSVATGTKVVWKAVNGSHTVNAYRGLW